MVLDFIILLSLEKIFGVGKTVNIDECKVDKRNYHLGHHVFLFFFVWSHKKHFGSVDQTMYWAGNHNLFGLLELVQNFRERGIWSFNWEP